MAVSWTSQSAAERIEEIRASSVLVLDADGVAVIVEAVDRLDLVQINVIGVLGGFD